MPSNINEETQHKRRKDAIHSAVSSTVMLLVSAVLILLCRWHFQMGNLLGAVLLLLSVLDLGTIIPIWILLKTRLKEIEGGEEDAAAQY